MISNRIKIDFYRNIVSFLIMKSDKIEECDMRTCLDLPDKKVRILQVLSYQGDMSEVQIVEVFMELSHYIVLFDAEYENNQSVISYSDDIAADLLRILDFESYASSQIEWKNIYDETCSDPIMLLGTGRFNSSYAILLQKLYAEIYSDHVTDFLSLRLTQEYDDIQDDYYNYFNEILYNYQSHQNLEEANKHLLRAINTWKHFLNYVEVSQDSEAITNEEMLVLLDMVSA